MARHASEEVERLITIPVEREMNGMPQMTTIRSISLYGLSDVIMTFPPGTDNYFARQRTFDRIRICRCGGRDSSVAPCLAVRLIYRYVLRELRPFTDGAQDLQGWIVEPQFKSVSGVADDSGFGGGTMQYQVLLDPAKVASVGLSVCAGGKRTGGQQWQRRRRFYSQGGQFYYVRGLGRLNTQEDIGTRRRGGP